MKLKKNTLLLVLSAILLGTVIYLIEVRSERQKSAIINEQKKLTNIDSENIKKIIIDRSNSTLELMATDNDWQMIKPRQFMINDGVMAFLLDLIQEGKSDRIIKTSPDGLSQYSLEPSLATITIELTNGDRQQILLGKETIDSNLIYANVIPQQTQSYTEVLLVSKNWQYAINRDLAEWKDDVSR